MSKHVGIRLHSQPVVIHTVTILTVHLLVVVNNLEVCHPRCVCENWKGYVVKQNYVN